MNEISFAAVVFIASVALIIAAWRWDKRYPATRSHH
jgi:hypothetical protein